MTINTDNLSVYSIFGLVQKLTPGDQHWLAAQLNRLTSDEDVESLPESATFNEAIDLYLADKCSLGRAAELAGVTRWEIMDVLHERNIPTNGGHDLSTEEYGAMLDSFEGTLTPPLKIFNC